MSGRLLAVCAAAAVAAVLAVQTARPAEPPVVAAIRHEFGTGRLGGCFVAIAWRESRYRARAANWTDRHADGSVGSFGPFQIGALWRAPGETVGEFAQRMYRPAEAARLAHRIYRLNGLQPWGNRC